MSKSAGHFNLLRGAANAEPSQPRYHGGSDVPLTFYTTNNTRITEIPLQGLHTAVGFLHVGGSGNRAGGTGGGGGGGGGTGTLLLLATRDAWEADQAVKRKAANA